MSDSLENDTAVEENANPSVARSTALMSIATLFSRATGLIRTWAMAFALGNSLITSSYQVANNMPNVIYELVAGGLLAAAFLPVYMLEKERGGEKSGNEFANNLLNITIVVLGILSILATIFAPQVIATQTFTVSEDAEVYQRAVAFFRIFAMQIVFYGIGGIVTGLLNANRVFFLPSMAPAVNNVIVTAAFFAYIPLSSINFELAIMVLAIGTTVGVAAQFLIQIPALIKLGFKYRPHINLKDPALIEALKIAAPTLLYIVGTMVAFSCRNAFSLQAGENGPSTLLYAWTWYQLPYGVIAVSLSRALFTEMGEAVAKEDWPNMRSLVHTGYSATLLLIIPLAAIMVSVSVPIMELFQVGAFSGDDVVYVARILSVWLISLPFYAIVMLLYNIYASMRKFFRFALVSTAMVAVQCALYYVLSSPALFGLAGVPIADIVYYAVCCLILTLMLRKLIGSFELGKILWTVARVVIASGVAVAVSLGLGAILPEGIGMIDGIIRIVVCGGVALVVAFGLCIVLKVPYMNYVTDLVGKVTRKLKRS